MKHPIAYIEISIFPDTTHWPEKTARITVTRLAKAPHIDPIKREYEFITESSFNRVMKAQRYFMDWNPFNKGLHRMGHISKFT